VKPLKDQTLVITSGSSGIGLATARLAVEAGANVVLVARSEDALSSVVLTLGCPGLCRDGRCGVSPRDG
jgi:NADP-dependent 3-hydroxy acid dehydrogenase YdfG